MSLQGLARGPRTLAGMETAHRDSYSPTHRATQRTPPPHQVGGLGVAWPDFQAAGPCPQPQLCQRCRGGGFVCALHSEAGVSWLPRLPRLRPRPHPVLPTEVQASHSAHTPPKGST